MFNDIRLLTEIYVNFVTYFISVFSTINLTRETVMRKPLSPTQRGAKNKIKFIIDSVYLFIFIKYIYIFSIYYIILQKSRCN